MSDYHFIMEISKILLMNATAATLGQGHAKVIQYISPDLYFLCPNKANLRDLIAATGLVILLKLDSNRRFFSPCDLEI